MMKSVALLLLSLLVAGGAPAAEITEVRYRADSSVALLLWVSAEAALDEEGVLKPSMLSRSALRRGKYYEEWNTTFRIVSDGDCPEAWGIPIGSGGSSKPDGTVDHLFEHAIGIYHGRIVALSYGFYSGEAGVLLRAAPVEVLRSSELIDLEQGLLVFHHYARFAAGGRKFCTGLSRAPKVGDEFLVFADHEPLDEFGAIIYAGYRIFFESPAGAPEALSPRFDLTGFPSLDSMVTAIRDYASLRDPIRYRLP